MKQRKERIFFQFQLYIFKTFSLSCFVTFGRPYATCCLFTFHLNTNYSYFFSLSACWSFQQETTQKNNLQPPHDDKILSLLEISKKNIFL